MRIQKKGTIRLISFVSAMTVAVVTVAALVFIIKNSFGASANTAYSQVDYNLAYEKAGQFVRRNAAVKALDAALLEQLPGWKTWRNLPYALIQANGQVSEVKDYPWDEQNLAQYKSYSGVNPVVMVLTNAVNNSGSGERFASCREIAESNVDLTYEYFSSLTNCVKENGGGESTGFFNVYYQGLLHDAETLLRIADARIATVAMQSLWYEEDVSTLSLSEMIEKLEATPYAEIYGDNYYGHNSFYNSWGQLMWDRSSDQNIYSESFDENAIGTMSDKDRGYFATLYAMAKRITSNFVPGSTFEFDFDQFMEQPSVEERTETETVTIPFETITVKDNTLPLGQTKVMKQGVNGQKKITYKVTLTNGVETAREIESEEIVLQPEVQVVAEGTDATPNADVRNEVETTTIPFETVTVKDTSLPVGQTRILVQGVNGQTKTTYAVTYVNGVATSRVMIAQEITQPVTQIIAEGAYVAPNVTIETETTTSVIPFEVVTIKDDTLPIGETKVISAGSNGEKRIVYEVTYTNGVETSRRLVSEDITLAPTARVVIEGAYKPDSPDEPDEPDKPDNPDKPDSPDKPIDSDNPGDTKDPDATDNNISGSQDANNAGSTEVSANGKNPSAPDTGGEAQANQSAIVIRTALGATATLVGITGFIIILKRQKSSPLKRK